MENHFIFGQTENIKGILSISAIKTLLLALLIVSAFGVCPSNEKIYADTGIYSVKIDLLDDEGKLEKTNTIFVDKKIDETQMERAIYTYLKKRNDKLVDADFSDNVNITVEPAENAESADAMSGDEATKHILEMKMASVVTVEKETKVVKKLNYKTVVKKTPKLRKTLSKVKRRGRKGKIISTKLITRENGVLVKESKAKKHKIAPVHKVIHKGTGSLTVYSGKMYRGTKGKDIIKFAKKFLGNPYRYGGTSLTRGADCSGFVYSIYRHYGLDVPRVGQSRVGKRVSVKRLKPGDVVEYSGHMAIYAGNGKVIHALNRRRGICISSLYLVGRPLRVSRIVKY